MWGIRDEEGFPAPQTPNGRAMPFWSKRSRAERVIAEVPTYARFNTVELSLDEWRSRWLPGLQRDGVRIGLNWSGDRATGFDLPASDVEANLKAREAR